MIASEKDCILSSDAVFRIASLVADWAADVDDDRGGAGLLAAEAVGEEESLEGLMDIGRVGKGPPGGCVVESAGWTQGFG